VHVETAGVLVSVVLVHHVGEVGGHRESVGHHGSERPACLFAEQADPSDGGRGAVEQEGLLGQHRSAVEGHGVGVIFPVEPQSAELVLGLRVHPFGDLHEVASCRTRQSTKLGLACAGRGAHDIDTIENGAVDVELKIEGRPCAMKGRDTGPVGLPRAREPKLLFGCVALPAHDLAYEDRDDLRAEVVVVGHGESEAWRKGTNPLPHRHDWENEIDEPRGSGDHPSARATRTETATPAGQPDEPLEGARRTFLHRETKFQLSAARKSLELAPHEGRQGPVRGLYFGDE
jgi:hypothetical protein